MTRTTFIDGTTAVTAAWLNETDNQTQNAVGSLTNAVERSVQNKFTDLVSVRDFGAVGDGITDDSQAFIDAFAVSDTVMCVGGDTYLIKNITIGTHKTLYADGALFTPASGASYGFLLTGYKPALVGGYFTDAASHIPNDLEHGFIRVQACEYPTIRDCMFVHTVLPIYIGGDSSEVKKGLFDGITIIDYSSRGILVGKNTNTCTFSNIRCYAGTVAPDFIPKRNTIGFQIISTGSTVAFGGHLVSNVDCAESEIGFQFTNTNLISLQNCIADTLAGTGYQVSGTSDKIKFSNCFVGTAKLGYEIVNTSTNVWIDGATTVYQGVVPTWWVGPTDFYLSSGNYGDAKDIYVSDAAQVVIGSWFGEYKFYSGGTAIITFDSGESLYAGSVNTVSSGTTTYLTPAGDQSLEIMSWVAPKAGFIYGMVAQNNTAPGVGQSFTYSVRKNFADAGPTCTTSGSSGFASNSSGIVLFSAGDNLGVKLETSASAANAYHRVALKVRYVG